MLKKLGIIMIIAMTAMVFMPASAFAGSGYMPNVTKEMSSADYWIQKTGDPDQVLADRDEINAVNQAIVGKGGPGYDFANWSAEEFNATAASKALVNAADQDDLPYYWSNGCHYDQQGNRYYDNEYELWKANYQSAVDNCMDPDVAAHPEEMVMKPYQYAVVTTRTTLQGVPTNLHFWDDPDDPDFDWLYHTMLKVNEPLVVRTKSLDGQFYNVYSSVISGWVRADCIAICKDKEEWWDAWLYPEEETLVVLDDKIYTEDSNYAPEIANRKIPMGSCLHLAAESEWTDRIVAEVDRSAHNNYVIWMPVRKDDGSYVKKLALIGENRKVSEGYPDLTVSNVLKVAMNQLGDAYGWGGMMGSEDCSGYMRDVYRCFGLDLARSIDRNKRWDTGEPIVKMYDLTGMTDAEKRDTIRRFPPGTVLTFSGHEMMYLGNEGDNLYVISSVSSCYLYGEWNRIRNCVINTLDDVYRGNGNSWLTNLNRAVVPYYVTDHPDPVLSIAKAEVSGITDRTYNGKAQTQKPVVVCAGRTLSAGEDYQLTYKNNKNAGTASCIIAGIGAYGGENVNTFTIKKAKNPMKAKGKMAVVKHGKLKYRIQRISAKKAYKITGSKGRLTYEKLKGNNKISVSSNGQIAVNRLMARGAHKVKIRVTDAGNGNYKSVSKTVTVTIRVK